MEFYFEIVLQPEKYHEAANAMSRLPQKASDRTKGIAGGEDIIPAFCIVGRISKPNTVCKEGEDEVKPFTSTKEIKKARANDMLFQNLKQVLEREGTITIIIVFKR